MASHWVRLAVYNVYGATAAISAQVHYIASRRKEKPVSIPLAVLDAGATGLLWPAYFMFDGHSALTRLAYDPVIQLKSPSPPRLSCETPFQTPHEPVQTSN